MLALGGLQGASVLGPRDVERPLEVVRLVDVGGALGVERLLKVSGLRGGRAGAALEAVAQGGELA